MLAPRPETFPDAAAVFLGRLTTDGRSPHTVAAYGRDLALIGAVLGTKGESPALPLTALTSGLLAEAFADSRIACDRAGTPRSAAGLHRLRCALRAFTGWAHGEGLLATDPGRSLPTRRLPRTTPKFLTEAEKRSLLKELKGRTSFADHRDRVIIEVFLGTGIRLAELAALDVDDVDLDAKHLHIRQAKGGVPQVKFLRTSLRTLLRGYLAERKKHAPGDCHALFLSARENRLSQRQIANRVAHWLGKAGIDKQLSPHALRHTFATHLYARTGDLLIVQRALGHRDITTTQVYTHLVDGALEEALEQL